MALTLRKTELAILPADLAHWTVYDDGRPVGHIYEEHAPSRPKLAWSWSILAVVDPQARILTSAKAASFPEATVDFAASWAAWKEWWTSRNG
jgi:hypothetical protein